MYSISFAYNKQIINFERNTKKDLYTDILDWLYDNGYKFDGPLHKPFSRKILSLSDIQELIKIRTSYRLDHFHNISSSGNYILCNKFGTAQGFDDIFKMLNNFGISKDQIKTSGLENENKIKKFGEITDEEDEFNSEVTEKTSFVNAAQIVLKDYGNTPMSAEEIWEEIELRNIVATKGSTPKASLNTILLKYSDNSNVSKGYKKKIFTIVGTNPNKFKLLNNEVQNVDDDFSDKTRFWIYAPGDSSKKWEEFYNEGIMGLGWDDLGDFDKLGSREDITLKLKETYPNSTSAQTNSSLAIFEFRDVIKPGDVIIVKQGTSAYLGYGIVVSDNYFDNDADELKNRREVDWKKKGLFPAGRTIVQKTLTDITKYPTYVKSLIGLIGIEEFMDEDDYSDLEDIKPFSKFPQPFDVESELKRAQAQSEDDLKSYSFPFKSDKEVMSFIDFKAMEPNEKFGENPFSQAICVLGESGAGKSTTVDNILQKSGHIYQYIIPSASTTGLLSQFSPSAGSAGGYIPSRLGQMIEKAYNNKGSNYTAVFDECHKTSIIEMINDELLQAISKNRNKGVRFISLDDDTRKLYPSAKEDSRGNILIPDNFGFIFISSNARVISGNPDFFNRVDLIELTEDDRKMKTIEELNQKRVTNTDDKKQLVNKIVSGGQ